MECKLEFIRRKHIWFCELIDTLWNVNKSVSDGDKVYVGINRYIMECKFITQKSIRPVLRELIDTLWNVNTPIYIATNWENPN